jgi:hypothetical protein
LENQVKGAENEDEDDAKDDSGEVTVTNLVSPCTNTLTITLTLTLTLTLDDDSSDDEPLSLRRNKERNDVQKIKPVTNMLVAGTNEKKVALRSSTIETKLQRIEDKRKAKLQRIEDKRKGSNDPKTDEEEQGEAELVKKVCVENQVKDAEDDASSEDDDAPEDEDDTGDDVEDEKFVWKIEWLDAIIYILERNSKPICMILERNSKPICMKLGDLLSLLYKPTNNLVSIMVHSIMDHVCSHGQGQQCFVALDKEDIEQNCIKMFFDCDKAQMAVYIGAIYN